MAHRLVCELPDVIAAIAPTIRRILAFDNALTRYCTRNLSRTTPVLQFHATNVGIYLFAGASAVGSPPLILIQSIEPLPIGVRGTISLPQHQRKM